MSHAVTVAVTLSAQHPDVKPAGTIDADGLGGVDEAHPTRRVALLLRRRGSGKHVAFFLEGAVDHFAEIAGLDAGGAGANPF